MLCCYVVFAFMVTSYSFANDVLPCCCCCADVLRVRFKLAAADPVAYYNILESACRTAARGNEGSSSSHSNKAGSSTASSSSSRTQQNSVGRPAGKESRGSGTRRSSSICKAESRNAPKGQRWKGARTEANSTSDSRAENTVQHNVSHAIFRQASLLLDAPRLSDKSGEHFILRTWQHYKAHLSAKSSLNKACIKLLLPLVERGLEVGLTANEEREFTQIVRLPPATMSDTDPDKGGKVSEHADAAEAVDGSLGGRQQQQQGGQAQQQQQQEVGQLQQEEQEQQRLEERQQGLGEQQHLAGCGKVGVQGCALDGMSTANTMQLLLVLGTARVFVALGHALLGNLAGSEEACQGGSEPITGSSSKGADTSIAGKSNHGALGINTGGLSSSSCSSSGEDIVVPASAARQMILVQMTTVALHLRECLAHWQMTASGRATAGVEQVTPPSSSAAAAAAAAPVPSASAATAAVLGDAAVTGQAAVRDESSDVTAAARTGSGAAASNGSALPSTAAASVVLPERFSWVPSRGLPAAVLDQLDHVSSSGGPPGWEEGNALTLGGMHRKVHGLAEVKPLQDQLDMLHELVVLFDVLLAEVACPLGCSNPGCVNLGGESEVREAHKACAACKVVYYCSRRCQVEHWKAGHGKICGRLGQQVQQHQVPAVPQEQQEKKAHWLP